MIDLDRVTAQALTDLERTEVGQIMVSWCEQLIEDRKNRLVTQRGLMNIPDLWHDQGFISGVQHVANIFIAAQNIVNTEEEVGDVQTHISELDPYYQGANPEEPRR